MLRPQLCVTRMTGSCENKGVRPVRNKPQRCKIGTACTYHEMRRSRNGGRDPSTSESRPSDDSPPLCMTNLNPQLHYRCPAAALILRRLGYRLHVRMLLQGLAQGFAQDAHAAAVDYAYARQSG